MTVDEDGNVQAGEESMQSADQESPYGSDPVYRSDVGYDPEGESETVYLVDEENLADVVSGDADPEELALEGDASNGTLHVLEVEKTAEVMNFTFTGTGFEIISRTTMGDYAVLAAVVRRTSDDQIVKAIPVITECVSENLYQIPVIFVDGLEYGEYKVTVSASGSKSASESASGQEIVRMLYIDGIRIYGPLNSSDADVYYNPAEAGAEFFKIKELIMNGDITFVQVTNSSENPDDLIFAQGSTVIEVYENRGEEDGAYCLRVAEDINEYLEMGPNNETYLNGSDFVNCIAFYAEPDEEVAESARTLQIGAHRKSNDELCSTLLVYGSTAESLEDADNQILISSMLFMNVKSFLLTRFMLLTLNPKRLSKNNRPTRNCSL